MKYNIRYILQFFYLINFILSSEVTHALEKEDTIINKMHYISDVIVTAERTKQQVKVLAPSNNSTRSNCNNKALRILLMLYVASQEST